MLKTFWVKRQPKSWRYSQPDVLLYGTAAQLKKGDMVNGFCYSQWVRFTGIRMSPCQSMEIRATFEEVVR